MKPRFPDNVKPCEDCGAPFPLPPGMTRRRWLFQAACLACEPARVRERIKAGVDVDANGCWLWRGSTAKMGYGQLSLHDTKRSVHVLAYEVFIGPVPEGLEVCHKCDVKRCCNPDHFFAGTHAENVKDMWAKGRGSPPPTLEGEAHPLAHVSDERVREAIRLRKSGMHQRDVAKLFGVGQGTIWRWVHGRVRRDATRRSA